MESPQVDIARLESLANTLAQGLESLLAEVQRRQKDERRHLSKYRCHATQLSQVTSQDAPGRHFLDELQLELSSHDQELQARAGAPATTEVLRAREAVANMSTPRTRPALQQCPVARQPTDQEDLEMDFTTPGVQGSLECPFAKMQNKLPITPNSIDPIAAEFHQDYVSVQASEGATNYSRCPIRFLEQHSPEEVAKYFENHKHEIPRSHEICVKRYQQNEHSIRELDAKYGSLVNMIQGLGVKHKQYLPRKEASETDHDDDEAEGRTSVQAVEKWAENISPPPEAEPKDLALNEEDRQPRFERPLREVRVGESPSRPWGISVPVVSGALRSVPLLRPQSLEGFIAVPVDATSTSATQKPASDSPLVVDGKVCQADKVKEDQRKDQPLPPGDQDLPAEETKAPTKAQIVFQGPVFFGYSPEQATAFLNNINLGSMKGS